MTHRGIGGYEKQLENFNRFKVGWMSTMNDALYTSDSTGSENLSVLLNQVTKRTLFGVLVL